MSVSRLAGHTRPLVDELLQPLGDRWPLVRDDPEEHALPLEDEEVADDIDRLLNLPPTGPFAVTMEHRPIEIEVPITPT
ncbi:MAG: hypothetical protein M0013_04685 [Actinomycetota bacterium]|nr:hypothetical protein [Actinomycetota bacterium]